MPQMGPLTQNYWNIFLQTAEQGMGNALTPVQHNGILDFLKHIQVNKFQFEASKHYLNAYSVVLAPLLHRLQKDNYISQDLLQRPVKVC